MCNYDWRPQAECHNTILCLIKYFPLSCINKTVLVIMNNDTDNTALVTISKTREEIVIAFRGTMNIWNVVFDAAMFTVDYPNVPGGIELHVGFYTAAVSLYRDVSLSTSITIPFETLLALHSKRYKFVEGC